MTKKQELIDFLNSVPEDHAVGIYYLDKQLNILHYNLYKKDDVHILIEKLPKYNNNLEDDFIQIKLWKSSPSLNYLVGVYDGLVNVETDAE